MIALSLATARLTLAPFQTGAAPVTPRPPQANSARSLQRAGFAGIALALMLLAIWQLESYRKGIDRIALPVGTTPATLYQQPGAEGPLVIVAHGFAGSRRLMEAISLTLARGGYRALAFDFEGHGRNGVPMGGDVAAIDGTTARLVAETRRVVAAGIARTGWQGPVALIGHSMASDVVVRSAAADPAIGPVAAISMYSEAVSPDHPQRLLIVTGAWEPGLRPVAVEALRMVDPGAEEGDTVRSGEVWRRAVVAPGVEHAGVLFAPTTLRALRDFLDLSYDRRSDAPIAATGGWIALLLGATLALGRCLAGFLERGAPPRPIPVAWFLIAVAAPAGIAPLLATQVRLDVLPVLVADYLALHLLIYGVVQIAVLRLGGARFGPLRPGAALALTGFGVLVFGLLLDRYAASFVPTGLRWLVLAGALLGTVPFMIGDAMVSAGGYAPVWRRVLARLGFLASLGAAVWLDFERLMFLVIILPVIVLFFALYGTMGRWVGLRAGPMAAGVALGVILAWSLAASFPLFQS
ncbi:MAG: alpha/beta hydrolase [Rhodobacteraceae bacterium]|nr:alpha/beta hydrolase [Paracoccaceae bacterium]